MTNQLARIPLPIPTYLRLALALGIVVMFVWLINSSRAATFTVTNMDDSGAGSLRQAILDSNATAGQKDTIAFNIPGTGVRTITPRSSLPLITDPVIIDGTTQPGFAGSPIIELNGANTGGTIGLIFSAGSSVVRGLVINRFNGSGITLRGIGNAVEGNFIGTDATGKVALGNVGTGVLINGPSAGNTIGGTTIAARNIISANGNDGIQISDSGSTGNIVQGNYIGTDVTGTADLGNGGNGVTITSFASNNTIGGTTPGARNVISGNNTHGIQMSGNGATGNQVQGNYIGTDVNGLAKLGNTGIGVFINNSSNNAIGGTPTGARNIISGNGNGIGIFGSAATGNQVQGNYIGTDVNGTSNLGNSSLGVTIDSSSNNTIGGTAAGARNIISCNGLEGIQISGNGATGNQVQGNYIGTDVNGVADLGNGQNGVLIIINATNNTIGGTAAGARNVISGNNDAGIKIIANGNQVLGNYIGTDANGTAGLGNTNQGVRLLINASNNKIGGTAAGARNVISGNGSYGVLILDSNSTGNVVEGNYIGTDVNGLAALGNSQYGILIAGGALSNTIGGPTSGASNTIAFNLAGGVFVGSGVNNAILSNSIHSNTGLGIDLGLTGVTANDACDADTGANNLQNVPVLTSASTTSIQGTLNSTANTTFTIQFFSNAACDPSGNGEGQTFLGSTTVTTDAACNASFSFPTTVSLGQVVTATATDPTNNTSEFSQCRVVTGATLKITGHITDDSANSLASVSVSLSGGASGNTTTDGNGNYSFLNLVAGTNYTVTPGSSSHSFFPSTQTFNNLTVDRIANFVGTQTVVSISGSVTDSNNIGVITLTLTKNGTVAGTVQTEGLGSYSFGNLTAGANYVVTPAGSFTPSSQTFTNLTSNAVANFKATPSIPSQCNASSFAAAINFSAGNSPESVAVGDFNGDGKLDLAVVTGNGVSILLGTGTGSFSAATNFAVGTAPKGVAVGDFNGDGKLDLAVPNRISANVSILLGTGTGSFSAATNFAVDAFSQAIAPGDFNGDGKLDLAVPSANNNRISILLGTGTGSFSPAGNFAAGTAPAFVAVGDLNGDGKLDLAVANANSNTVSILPGTGTGSFSAATTFPVGSTPVSISMADFNGDGKLDLAVANSSSNNVSILPGTGTGSFSAATNFAVGARPNYIAAGDFNGDGKPDLATANADSNNASILLGTGTGSFNASTNFAVVNPLTVAVGDLNGDGKLDLAVADSGPPNRVSILLNNGAICNTQTSLTISGQITDAGNNPLSNNTVTLSGPITRVVQSDINGNYAFANLAPGGDYAVTVQSPYFVFSPSRADFFNLSSNQTANFTAAPVAVPSPTPPLSDDFNSPTRDATKWTLGTQTQPAAAVDPQVTTAQLNGQLVITPLNQASGMHYNGYVAANSFDMRNGKASVEVVKAATGGADTTFAVGSDSNNFFRFLVHTPGAPTSLVTGKGDDGLEPLDTTTPQLIFQVKINGLLTSLSIDYDPVLHRFMRFRHEPPQVSPTDGAIVFETSPNNIDFTVRHRILLERGISPLTAELSAGTSSPTNPGPAVFDNLTLTTSTFQFSAGGYTVGEGDGSVLITVTRAGSATDAGSVDYATADGTAHQGSRYLNAAGRLTFAPGQTSRTFTVLIVDTDLAEGNQTLDLVLSNPVGAGFNSPGRAVLNIVDNDTVVTPIFQPVALAASQVTINTWTFAGTTYAYLKLSFPNAGYRVVNFGLATRVGNDFTGDAAVERFTGASVQAVTTTAGIYDLGALAPGSYNFTFKNNGTVVKSQAFTVAAPPFPANPIDTAREFVKQQYRDFLNREADQAGEDFWTDNITKCSDPARRPPGQTEAQCTLRQRETTSGAFFLSPEFQYTGYYVLRMYKGALGRQPKLSEFIPDAQFVGAGILVNSQLSAAKINQNKVDFAAQFVNCTDGTKSRCAEFKTIYDGLNNQQYVDKLFQTTGVNASASDRAALVNGLSAIPATDTRASVLQKVVDGIVVISEGNQTFTTTYGQAFYTAESNRAFVQLEYFGYMKRDPDDAGYAFWLGKLNQFSGNFVNAEMVLAFISSPEYRARFGQP